MSHDLTELRRDLDRLARRLALLEAEQEQRQQTEAWIAAEGERAAAAFDECFASHGVNEEAAC